MKSGLPSQLPPLSQSSNQDETPVQPLFERYRPSHRLAYSAYRQTVQALWATCGLSALFVWGFWGQPQWLNWSLLGISMGLLMLLRGARLLPRSGQHRLSLTNALTATRESWFRFFIFATQSLAMLCLGALLWFSLPAIGVPLNPALDVGFGAILLFIILRRFLNEWANCHPSDAGFLWHEVIRWVTVMLITILLAVATSHSVSPLGHPLTGDTTVLIIIIWVVAAFAVLCSLIMLIESLRRRRQD